MLSDDIRNIADELHRRQAEGAVSDVLVGAAVLQLWCLARNVSELEHQVVPAATRRQLDDLPENVVPLRRPGGAHAR